MAGLVQAQAASNAAIAARSRVIFITLLVYCLVCGQQALEGFVHLALSARIDPKIVTIAERMSLKFKRLAR